MSDSPPRSYTKKITFSGDQVDWGSFSYLTEVDWADWIKDRLHGLDRVLPPDEDGIHGSVFGMITPELDSSSLDNLLRGYELCLDEAEGQLTSSRRQEVYWTEEGLAGLFSLPGHYETDGESERLADIETPFVTLVDRLRGFLGIITPRPEVLFTKEDEETPDFYGRVLQSIISTRAKLPYEFWSEQIKHSSTNYAHFCFEGAMNNSPYDAIQLLSEVDWSTEHTRQLIGTYIMLFYMDYKDDQNVIDALQEQAKVLPGEAQQTIEENIRLALEV